MGGDAIDVDLVMRSAIGGDAAAIAWVKSRASTAGHAGLSALAGILEGREQRLVEAMSAASSTRDRQIVAIADAHLRGRHDLVDALARDHLVDHPDSVLVAWIAAGAGGAGVGDRTAEGRES